LGIRHLVDQVFALRILRNDISNFGSRLRLESSMIVWDGWWN
jgi:hypothetical protein